MKLKRTTNTFALVVVTALATAISVGAQTTYNVVTLPTLGGSAGAANSINDRGWATGLANFAGDTVGHAALWVNSSNAINLGALGGPTANSVVAWPVPNVSGLIVGISDTADDNPYHEAFSCWPFFTPSSPTGKICKGFRWQNNSMSPLPPFPGGFNSYATSANNRGQIVGWAENGVQDRTCNPQFQTLQFRAVIWQPDGSMQELPPLPGDSTSAATAINDLGQVVGISGDCEIAFGFGSAAHAVLWQNGTPVNLGDLGGHSWNTPTAINNQETIVGFSLPASQDGTTNFVAVIWDSTGAHQLGMPSGDDYSEALGVNGKGQIVGLSHASTGIHAMLWQNGTATDLNKLTQPGSPKLLFANDINDAGRIAGEAFDKNAKTAPAYVAIPLPGSSANTPAASANAAQPITLPVDLEKQIERRGLRFGADPTR